MSHVKSETDAGTDVAPVVKTELSAVEETPSEPSIIRLDPELVKTEIKNPVDVRTGNDKK